MPSIGSMIHWRVAVARDAELLAEDAVLGALGLEDRADRTLGGEIGLGDVARVGLQLDVEIGGVEAGHGCRIRRIREPQREFEIGAQIPVERRVERRRRRGGGHVVKDIGGEGASISE